MRCLAQIGPSTCSSLRHSNPPFFLKYLLSAASGEQQLHAKFVVISNCLYQCNNSIAQQLPPIRPQLCLHCLLQILHALYRMKFGCLEQQCMLRVYQLQFMPRWRVKAAHSTPPHSRKPHKLAWGNCCGRVGWVPLLNGCRYQLAVLRSAQADDGLRRTSSQDLYPCRATAASAAGMA